MSAKGKPKYNRAIALAKIQKAVRLLEDVYGRHRAQANNWAFANASTALLIEGVYNILAVAEIQERLDQEAKK